MTLSERIEARTGPPDENGCRRWLGGSDGDGYGVVWVGGRSRTVARVLLAEKLGRPIGPGLCALHKCPGGGNPWCVAAEHLVEGTHAENMRDKVAHGRQARGESVALRGERSGNAKLTESDARTILAARARGERLRTIAARFGVTHGQVWKICAGRRWQHLTPP